ncbi:MAG: LamG-like jellyroll fold domain-containing protein [Chloroflexota bacterium]
MKTNHIRRKVVPFTAVFGLLLAMLVSIPAASQADEIDGLINHWPLDGSAEDIVGGNNGLEAGGIDYVSDPERGTVLSCDGSNDFISVDNQVTNNFTISAWIKSDVDSALGDRLFQADGLIWAESSDSESDFQILLINNRLVYSEGGEIGYLSISDVIDGTWHHIAVTHQNNGRFRIYVDGELEVQARGVRGALDANPLITFCADLLDQNYYEGLLDNVKIFNRRLSNSEVDELANEPIVPPTPTPTLTAIPTNTPTPTPTATATSTPVGTPTPVPTAPPTATATPGVPTCPTGRIQAESGDLIGDMATGSSSTAEGGTFVHAPNSDTEFYTEANSFNHRADYCVGIETAGIYRIRVAAQALSGADNSFYVTLDGEPTTGDEAYWEVPVTNPEEGVEPPFEEYYLTFRNIETFEFIDRQPFLTPGNHTLSFRAREDGTRIDAFEFEFVRGNLDPVIFQPGDQFNVVGDVLALKIKIQDPDGTVPTLSATGLPPGVTVDSANLMLTGNPTAAGIYRVSLTAEDGSGGSDTIVFNWEVVAEDIDLPFFIERYFLPLTGN